MRGEFSNNVTLSIDQTLYDQDDELESMGLEEYKFKF